LTYQQIAVHIKQRTCAPQTQLAAPVARRVHDSALATACHSSVRASSGTKAHDGQYQCGDSPDRATARPLDGLATAHGGRRSRTVLRRPLLEFRSGDKFSWILSTIVARLGVLELLDRRVGRPMKRPALSSDAPNCTFFFAPLSWPAPATPITTTLVDVEGERLSACHWFLYGTSHKQSRRPFARWNVSVRGSSVAALSRTALTLTQPHSASTTRRTEPAAGSISATASSGPHRTFCEPDLC
jgi:hypothetical protein